MSDEIIRSEIRVTHRRTNVLTRWPCFICAGWTEKEGVLARFEDVEFPHGEHVVCGECLKAGADAVPARLEGEARRLDYRAAVLRAYAQARWVMPTYEEWETAVVKADEWLDRTIGEATGA